MSNSEYNKLFQSTFYPNSTYNLTITPGKLNSQFIITARMDFQIFSDYLQYIRAVMTLALPPQVLQLKGVALAIVSSNLSFLALFSPI